MSGLLPFTRHPDRRKDPHDRARRLASDALLAPLDQLDAAWLEDHLAECQSCASDASGFAEDVALLEALRAATPSVPRDLGARVALALDDEARRAARRRPARFAARGTVSIRGRGGRSTWRSGAFVGLAAAALVAVLVLPIGLMPGAAPSAPPLAASPLPAATPLTVDTQPVAWARRTTDGRYVISSAAVDRVCPGIDASSCGTIDGGALTLAALDVKPSSVVLPRDGGPAVVVGDGTVYAVAVISGGPVTPTPPGPSPLASGEPLPSPTVPGASATPPTDSPAPSDAPPTPEPVDPDPSASVSPDPTASIEPSAVPGSPSPTGPPESPTVPPGASGAPVETPGPEPATPLPTLPPVTPAPTAAAALAIAENVIIVGSPPAYSPDGTWVAFSARPAGGEHGPDVYAWRVGDRRARAITDDHGSVFSGWLGDRILASTARLGGATQGARDARPAPDADPATVVARSFIIDPSNRSTTTIARAGVWLPVVDPTGRLVVYWTGSLAWDGAARAWLPASGRLVAATWRSLEDTGASPDEIALPAAVAGPATSSFEVRFDPAGRRLVVWVADPDVPNAGRLGLVAIDDDATLGAVLLADAAALPGFSLDADRLAWSTPPGRNGQGSLVTVYAWRGEDAGQVYSVPDAGDEPLVVAR